MSQRVESLLTIIGDNYIENSPPSNRDDQWWDDYVPENDTNEDYYVYSSGWDDWTDYYEGCGWWNFYCLFNGTLCTDDMENTTK